MKNKKETFVQRYESILSIKEAKELHYTWYDVIYQIIAFVLILSIFLGIGYITDILKNFNYVAYSLFAAVFGSFLFIRNYQETRYKEQNEVGYSTFTALCFDAMKVLWTISFIMILLFLVVFSELVTIFDYAFILLVLLIASIIYIALFRFDYRFILVDFEMIMNTLFGTILFLTGFRLLVYPSIIQTITCWTIIVSGIFLSKVFFRRLQLPLVDTNEWKYFYIMSLVLFLLGLLGSNHFEIEDYSDYIGHEFLFTTVGDGETEVDEAKRYFTNGIYIYITNDYLESVYELNGEVYRDVIHNDHISSTSVLFTFQDELFLETVVEEENGFTRYTYKYDFVNLELDQVKEIDGPVYFHTYHELNHEKYDGSDMFFQMVGDKVFFISGYMIYEYDMNMNFINKIPFPTIYNGSAKIIDAEDELYIFTWNRNNDDTYSYEIHEFESMSNLVDIASFDSVERVYLEERNIPYVNEDTFYISIHNDVHLIEESNELLKIISLDGKVIYQDESQIQIGSDIYNYYSLNDNKAYYDGYMLYKETDGYYLSTLEDYLTDNKEQYIKLSTDLKIEFYEFYVSEENIILNSGTRLYRFDMNGVYQEVLRFGIYPWRENYYVYEKYFYLAEMSDDLNNPQLIKADLNNLSSTVFKTKDYRTPLWGFYGLGDEYEELDSKWVTWTFFVTSFIGVAVIPFKRK